MSTFQLLPPSRPSRGGSTVDPQNWMHRYKKQPPTAVVAFVDCGNEVTSPLKVVPTIRNGRHLEDSQKLLPIVLDTAFHVDYSLP
jgi:hypothetical protein